MLAGGAAKGMRMGVSAAVHAPAMAITLPLKTTGFVVKSAIRAPGKAVKAVSSVTGKHIRIVTDVDVYEYNPNEHLDLSIALLDSDKVTKVPYTRRADS